MIGRFVNMLAFHCGIVPTKRPPCLHMHLRLQGQQLSLSDFATWSGGMHVYELGLVGHDMLSGLGGETLELTRFQRG